MWILEPQEQGIVRHDQDDQAMKTRITRSKGVVSLVHDIPGERPLVLASMLLYEGTGCWQLTDVRLSEYQKPSPWNDIAADKVRARVTYKNDAEKEIVLKLLREYEIEEEKKAISWCTYDGLVKGHESVNGNYPAWRHSWQPGYFSQKEGLEKLHEIKAFWDTFDGNIDDIEAARQPNPLWQPSETEVRSELILAEIGIKPNANTSRLAKPKRRTP